MTTTTATTAIARATEIAAALRAAGLRASRQRAVVRTDDLVLEVERGGRVVVASSRHRRGEVMWGPEHHQEAARRACGILGLPVPEWAAGR